MTDVLTWITAIKGVALYQENQIELLTTMSKHTWISTAYKDQQRASSLWSCKAEFLFLVMPGRGVHRENVQSRSEVPSCPYTQLSEERGLWQTFSAMLQFYSLKVYDSRNHVLPWVQRPVSEQPLHYN